MKTNNIDINKIVLEAFKGEFPGAPEGEVNELIDDIGQTIVVESLAKVMGEIEEKSKIKMMTDPSGPDLFAEATSIMEAENSDGGVVRMAQICEELGIDLEAIYQETATDVVKDVLRK